MWDVTFRGISRGPRRTAHYCHKQREVTYMYVHHNSDLITKKQNEIFSFAHALFLPKPEKVNFCFSGSVNSPVTKKKTHLLGFLPIVNGPNANVYKFTSSQSVLARPCSTVRTMHFMSICDPQLMMTQQSQCHRKVKCIFFISSFSLYQIYCTLGKGHSRYVGLGLGFSLRRVLFVNWRKSHQDYCFVTSIHVYLQCVCQAIFIVEIASILQCTDTALIKNTWGKTSLLKQSYPIMWVNVMWVCTMLKEKWQNKFKG